MISLFSWSVDEKNTSTVQPSIDVKIPKTEEGIIIKFRLGTEIKDCEGSGFCDMLIGHDLGLLVGNAGGAIASNHNGSLELKALKSTMSLETLSSYFINHTFIMQGKFDIPQDIVQVLNLDKSQIDIGMYEVEDLGETLRIRFAESSF